MSEHIKKVYSLYAWIYDAFLEKYLNMEDMSLST